MNEAMAEMPTLLPIKELQSLDTGYNDSFLPVDLCDIAIANRRAEEPTHNAVTEAVQRLLSEAATVIKYVNTNQIKEPRTEYDERCYFADHHIGFNDHAGGSESDYMILINKAIDSSDEYQQYVLFSPPPSPEEESPNKAFHAASFTFPTFAKQGTDYLRRMPNELKTSGAAGYSPRPGRDFEFFLFGENDEPAQLIKTLGALGFTFSNEPYSELDYKKQQLFEINHQARNKENWHSTYYAWPDQQFHKELDQLAQLDPTKL